jgi:glycosyltransferase involved in cell wall biosynthesis
VADVTFLMPVFNGGSFLRAALSSVFAQPRDWHVLVVDDGSTDGSWEYLQPLAGPNIDVIRTPRNLGLYGALNYALAYVRTAWTSLIFQDDRLKPDYLAEMRALAVRHPDVPLLWAAIDVLDVHDHVTAAGLASKGEESIEPAARAWRDVLLRGTYWTISGSFSRTAVLRRLGFRADLPHTADFEFLARAVRTQRLLYFESALVQIRQHGGQASAGNLAVARDLRERIQVIHEQLHEFPEDATLRFRLQLSRRLGGEITKRALGAARHGRWRLIGICLALLPGALSVAAPKRIA